MPQLLSALILIFLSQSLFACGEHPIISYTKDDGTRMGLVIPESELSGTPEWDITQGEPPLSITTARDAVLSWAKEKYARYDSVKISAVSLREASGCHSIKARWIYVFDLQPVIDDNALWGSGNWAAVLMDGTVIGTREVK